MSERMAYNVPGISCGHCEQAIGASVGTVPGVTSVSVEREAKTVLVSGEPADAAVRLAIHDAGYEVVDQP